MVTLIVSTVSLSTVSSFFTSGEKMIRGIKSPNVLQVSGSPIR